MATERISLTQPIESRDGTFSKDSYTSNGVFETRRGKREFVKRPGLINVVQLTPITPPAYLNSRGMGVWGTFLIAVVGTTVYSYGFTGVFWTVVTVGTIADGNNVYFTPLLPSNSNTTVFQGGFGGVYVINSGGTIVSVGGGSPPGTYVPGIAYLNNAVYVGTNYANFSNRIYNSNATTGNVTDWNASSYVTFYQTGDSLVGICKHLNYIVAFGTFSTQFYYDNGANQPFPQSPLAVAESYTNEIGCANGDSIVATSNTILWIGTSLAYGKSVYMMDGVSPIKVSTDYVDKFLEGDPLTHVSSYVYKFSGHTLYVLTLQHINITLAYDLDEKEWYNWTQYSMQSNDQPNPGTFQESYFRPTFYAEMGGVPYALDDDTATIYTFDPGTYQDNGQSIYYRGITNLTDNGTTGRKFYGRLEIVGDKVSATLQVSHTGDDYNTWSTPRPIDLSASRSQIYQCGADRRRAWQFLCTDNVPLRLEVAEIDFSSADPHKE